MKLREAALDDVQSIAEIHTMSWRNTYKNALKASYLSDVAPQERIKVWEGRLGKSKSNQYVVVAESEGEVIGFACAYSGENPKWGSYLDNLHVRKETQAKGVGKSLLLDAANWCYQQEPNGGMCLLVNQDNIKAQRFYKSLGACNTEESVWSAPDGSMVPTYWFVWNEIDSLRKYG